MNENTIIDESLIKEGYKPRYVRRKRRSGLGTAKQRAKNKLRYKKNKWKLKMYNRKYRQRNKMQLSRRRTQRLKRKKFKVL